MVLPLSSIGKEQVSFQLQSLSEEYLELMQLGCSGPLIAEIKATPTVTSLLVELVVRGSISLDCGRCLDKLTGAFGVKLRLLVETKMEQGLEWVEDEDQGIEEYLVKTGPDVVEIPLDHIIAEQIILNYNLHPLPTLDDKNKCIQCGRQAYQAEAHARKGVDPRWEKLQAFKRPTDPPGEG